MLVTMKQEQDQAMSHTTESPAERIRCFWDERARQFGTSERATLGETYLRHVEVRTMLARLRQQQPVLALDVGCGNGFSTKAYAAAMPGTHFTGIDFSPEMIRCARENTPPNATFAQADVTDAATLPPGPFDVVFTQRCIQNLPDYATQRVAIDNLLALVKPKGVLILNECSRPGVEQLNRLRVRLGLKPIEGIEPWHNCFMIDENLQRDYGAGVQYISSTYMFLAKVVHKRLAKYARFLPAFGRFGYDRFYVIRPTCIAHSPAVQPQTAVAA